MKQDDYVAQWRAGHKDGVWKHCCGFFDLTLDEFMAIQHSLWEEQMQLLPKSELGRKLLGHPLPRNLSEFREKVPFTTYEDYEPHLSERREDVLPLKPHKWIRSSGIGGRAKWIPFSERAWEVAFDSLFAVYVLSTATDRAKFSLEFGDVQFFGAAPPPYGSGASMVSVSEKYGLPCVPTLEQVLSTPDLATRAQLGFRQAIYKGLDILTGIPGPYIRMGEQFGKMKRRPSLEILLKPGAAYRILKGVVKSKLGRRPMLPRDVWNLKGLPLSGADLEAYRKKLKYYWGKDPYEFYVCTELGGPFAFQSWTHRGMTPAPHVSFLELIPEEELQKTRSAPSYRPRTVLLNEVEAGKIYEIAFTNFYGGIFTRYRPGDLLKIVALEDKEAGIKLPQLTFIGRADKLINIGGFTRLDERTLWLALERARVEYEGWMARLEIEGDSQILHFYLSTRAAVDRLKLQEVLHSELMGLDASYRELADELRTNLVRVTLLAWGVFQKYDLIRQSQGADPGHMKEIHMQPSQEVVKKVLELASE